MVIFPILSALISALCAVVITRDAVRKPRPDKVAWVVAFTIFAIAAATEAVGSLAEWTPIMVRVYYLTGAVLVVGYLALGELYLLAGKRIARFAPGVTIFVTMFAAVLVFNSPVDESKLANEGWEALEKSTLLTITTVTLNAGGTLVIVGGLLYSAWKFRRLGIQRNRMIGCSLIALGTVIVAMGGTATRLGQREYFYVAMSIGVAIIFAGYLWTRRPEGAPLIERRVKRTVQPVTVEQATPASVSRPAASPALTADPGIAFLEAAVLPLEDDALNGLCSEWSVARDDLAVLRRDEAIAAWQLRLLLTPDGQLRFDRLGVPARRQVVDLHRLVLTADPVALAPHDILLRR